MPFVHALLGSVGFFGSSVAAGYAVAALIAVVLWRKSAAPTPAPGGEPVTVLKPLCGAEPGLYEHLRSFCLQDYPTFQVVFGVHDPTDPALAAIRRLVLEFPLLRIDVVVNPQRHGSNYKIGNLINMTELARHEVLVLADSDTWVGPDYLVNVTAPLRDRGVGLVTCIYHDVPTARIWSRLGAMYINEWYMPSVLLARLFGFKGYASGQTLCLRRETLHAIGGFEGMANHLADDYRLGELVRGLGLRIVLSRYPVRAQHHEPGFTALLRHEIRWMRTLRVLRPRSFRALFISFSLPLAILSRVLCAAEPALSTAAWTLLWSTIIARLAVHFLQRPRGQGLRSAELWLLPIRDLLMGWVWCACFFGSRVSWRGHEFAVDADGIMHRAP